MLASAAAVGTVAVVASDIDTAVGRAFQLPVAPSVVAAGIFPSVVVAVVASTSAAARLHWKPVCKLVPVPHPAQRELAVQQSEPVPVPAQELEAEFQWASLDWAILRLPV